MKLKLNIAKSNVNLPYSEPQTTTTTVSTTTSVTPPCQETRGMDNPAITPSAGIFVLGTSATHDDVENLR